MLNFATLVAVNRRYAKAWTVRYAQMVKNCSSSELIPILPKYSELDSSTIYSDCRKVYDGLVDYTALAYYRVKHSKNEF